MTLEFRAKNSQALAQNLDTRLGKNQGCNRTLSTSFSYAIHRLVPKDFWLKMRYVFDDYGCLICGAESGYHSNGLCHQCYDRTRKKVLFSTRRHAGRKRKGRLDLELFRQQKLARNLLSRYASQGAISPKPRSVQVAQNNPVYEALAAKLEPSQRSD